MFPPIHPEGYRFIAIFAGTTVIISLFWAPFWAPGVLLTLWCTAFFRNPEREVPQGKGLIIAPADGKVCLVEKAPYPEELGGGRATWRVSVFMNVFNVHVNRIPVAGTIRKLVYVPGKFFNAELDKASKDNERQIIEIALPGNKKLAFVQIAGLIARRIVCYLKEGDKVRAGERFGLIRFGSRVDVYLPEGVEPLVQLGQSTVAGETVIAKLGGN